LNCGDSVELVETHGNRLQTLPGTGTGSEEDREIQECSFRPLPLDYLRLRYSTQVLTDSEVSGWLQGDSNLIAKRIEDLKKQRESNKTTWINKMNESKRDFMAQLPKRRRKAEKNRERKASQAKE